MSNSSYIQVNSLKNQQKINLSKEILAFLNSFVRNDDLSETATPEEILKFVKVMGNHKNTADEIQELKNGYFASYGTDNKLTIYNKQFNVILPGDNLDDWISYILEITSSEKIEKDIQIIICTNQSLYLNQINLEKVTSRIQRYEYGGMLCLELKKNNYVICGHEGADHFSDLFSKIIQSKKNRLFNEAYRGGIILNQNLVAFSSNVCMPGGEDKIKFYNPNSKKIVREIADYSFILSPTGLTLIESKNDDKKLNKIFLAACKKYYDNQKNGILAMISEFGESESMIHKFYDTGNFEVHCFCSLSIVDKKDINIFINNEIKKTKTDYFLVGGFDQDSRQGLIKLYKAKFDENPDETFIEFIQDIKVEKRNKIPENIQDLLNNKEYPIDEEGMKKLREYKQKKFKDCNIFTNFKGAVSSITQSSLYGNILVSCYDGNIYLLTPPNLEYYLKMDEEMESD